MIKSSNISIDRDYKSMENNMNTNFNKCKILSLFICVIVLLTAMPVKVIMAAEETNSVISEVEKETKETAKTSEKKEEKNVR